MKSGRKDIKSMSKTEAQSKILTDKQDDKILTKVQSVPKGKKNKMLQKL